MKGNLRIKKNWHFLGVKMGGMIHQERNCVAKSEFFLRHLVFVNNEIE